MRRAEATTTTNTWLTTITSLLGEAIIWQEVGTGSSSFFRWGHLTCPWLAFNYTEELCSSRMRLAGGGREGSGLLPPVALNLDDDFLSMNFRRYSNNSSSSHGSHSLSGRLFYYGDSSSTVEMEVPANDGRHPEDHPEHFDDGHHKVCVVVAALSDFLMENQWIIIPTVLLTVTLILAIVGLQTFYYTFVVAKAKLYVKSGCKFEELLRKEMPVLEEPYKPIPWCLEPRLQSILGHGVRDTLPKTKCQREILTMPDGINVGLDWLDTGSEEEEGEKMFSSPDSSSLLILVFPGLAGTSQSDYIRSLSSTVEAHHRQPGSAVRMVMVCYQGLNRVKVGAPRLVSSVGFQDAGRVVDHVSDRNPNAPILAVGVSAGAHILGSYLVMRSAEARKKLTAAMFICNLWDYAGGMANMERGFLNLSINGHIATQQVKRASRYQKVFDEAPSQVPDVDKALASQTMREFDSSLVAPANGFKDVDEYYTHVPLHQLIHDITVPSLAINAADDQFQPERLLPLSSFAESEKAAMMVTKRGGHLAFMEGWIPKQHNYLERTFSQFVSTVQRNVNILKSM